MHVTGAAKAIKRTPVVQYRSMSEPALLNGLKKDARDVRARMELVQRYRGQNRLQEAVSLLEQSIAVNGTEPRYRYALAHVYLGLGDAARALPVLQETLDKMTLDASYLSLTASAYSQLGKTEAAIVLFERVLKLAPTSGRDWINLGLARAATGDSMSARHAFDQALLYIHDKKLRAFVEDRRARLVP